MTLKTKAFGDITTFTRASGGGRFNSSGVYEWLPENEPRIDYDPVTLQPKGLLIEEQRTNRALNSNSFSASIGTLVLANTLSAPDGTQTADFIYEDTSSGEHFAADRSLPVAAGKIYVWSVFVKAPQLAGRDLYLRIAGAAVSGVLFNPQTKLISSLGPQNISFGFQEIKDGWFRVWNVFSATSTANAVCRVQLFNGTSIYTGDGVSGLYLWGAQLEDGAFPTSYIPTVASQVTRAADVASVNTLSPWYNASEGFWRVTAAGIIGQPIITVGSIQIIADTNSVKTYELAYTSENPASSLVIGRGHIQSIQYWPRADV